MVFSLSVYPFIGSEVGFVGSFLGLFVGSSVLLRVDSLSYWHDVSEQFVNLLDQKLDLTWLNLVLADLYVHFSETKLECEWAHCILHFFI